MSCQREFTSSELRFFQSKLPLCQPCHALAESAERQVEQALWRARGLARELLTTHILQGKLLHGGAGTGGVSINVEEAHAQDQKQ